MCFLPFLHLFSLIISWQPVKIPPFPSLTFAQVGRWGEELAYHLLKAAAEDGSLDQILPGVTSMGALAGPPGSPLHPKV